MFFRFSFLIERSVFWGTYIAMFDPVARGQTQHRLYQWDPNNEYLQLAFSRITDACRKNMGKKKVELVLKVWATCYILKSIKIPGSGLSGHSICLHFSLPLAFKSQGAKWKAAGEWNHHPESDVRLPKSSLNVWSLPGLKITGQNHPPEYGWATSH